MAQFTPSRSTSLPLSVPRVELRPLMKQVYMWMTLGMLITAGMSIITTTIEPIRNLALNPIIVFGSFIGQIGLVFALSLGIRRFSTNTATLMFFAYAALNGFTLSLVLLFASGMSIVAAFGSTVVLFGTMTVVGLTTQMDLTKIGTYLFVGLIALVIAMILNIFMQSSALQFLISIAGVVIFTGLTAYDTQRIKQMASDPAIAGEGPELMTKMAILGALTLYLDFINLFLFLLQIFGFGGGSSE